MLCTPETAVTELTETSQLILSSLKPGVSTGSVYE